MYLCLSYHYSNNILRIYDVTLLCHENVFVTSAIVGSSEMNIGDVVHQLVHLYVLFS